MKLNDNGEFVLTVDEVTNNLPFETSYVNQKFRGGVQKTLDLLSRQIYLKMYSASTMPDKQEHAKMIRKKIQKDEDAKDVVKWAMLQHVMGALTTGMDLNVYFTDGERYIPETVVQELERANLMLRGQIYEV